MKLKKLNKQQTIGLITASVIYALCIIFVAFGAQRDGQIAVNDSFAVMVCGLAWFFGVIGLRVYFQNKDMSDFYDVFGLKK